MTLIKAICFLVVWLWVAQVIYREARELSMNSKTWTVLWLIFPPTAIIYAVFRFRRLAEIKREDNRYRNSGAEQVPMFLTDSEFAKTANDKQKQKNRLQTIQARSTWSQAGIFVLVNAAVVASLAVLFPAVALFAPVIGISGAVISLFLSKWLAKRAHNAYIIDPQNFRNEYEEWLYNTVSDLALKARLPGMPEVAVYDSPEINAFATGASKSNALIAFSTGLLRKADYEAIKGIAAHEIAHVANGDMTLMTMVQAVVNTLILLVTLPLSTLRIAAFFSDNADWVICLIIEAIRFVLSIVLTFLGSLVSYWFSRRREFAADFGAATLVGRNVMVHALESLGEDEEVAPATQRSYAAFKINSTPRWLDIFSTHPSLQRRIDRLRQR
jgi:heat shock protein HtpX